MLRYFSLAIAMACSMMMWAQDVDSCQDVRTEEEFRQELWEFGEKSREHMIHKDDRVDSLIKVRQKNLLSFAKNMMEQNKNQVCIPTEINTILGYNDTISFYATPLWDSLYYESDREYITSLTVPLQFNTDKGAIASKMSVVIDKVCYDHIVSSNFTLSNDSTTKHLMVSYNIYGDLVGIHVFNDDMTLENSYITKDEPKYRKKMMAAAKSSKKSKSSKSSSYKYRYSQSKNTNILYRNDGYSTNWGQHVNSWKSRDGYAKIETQIVSGKEMQVNK